MMLIQEWQNHYLAVNQADAKSFKKCESPQRKRYNTLKLSFNINKYFQSYLFNTVLFCQQMLIN